MWYESKTSMAKWPQDSIRAKQHDHIGTYKM